MKSKKNKLHDAFGKALQSRIQGTSHAIKFISGFVLAGLKVRSANLSKIALPLKQGLSFYQLTDRFKDFPAMCGA